TSIQGDHHTQKRSSSTGAYTGYGFAINEQQTFVSVNDYGRIAPKDAIGQKKLNSVRWSNANIPGTSTNGYASFDAPDYKMVENSAGAIQKLVLTTKGIQEGGQLLIICENNSFSTLLGKRQIFGTDQTAAFTTTGDVIGEINAIRGNFGCVHPRSVVE